MDEATPTYITVAIHTYGKALELKSVLEAEGIETILQNINLKNPCVGAGVRVRIKETDLPAALRVIENPDAFSSHEGSGDGDRRKRTILVPVDFSDHSMKACEAAFSIATAQHASIHLLHTYTDPYLTDSLQLSESLTYEVEETFNRRNMQLLADRQMDHCKSTLRDRIKKGELPPVNISSTVVEGIPEEAIIKATKDLSPILVVMGTRGADAKERDLIGSVTAEVLDSSRVPVFTVPPLEKRSADLLGNVMNLMMFVNFDQEDFIALDLLHRFLPPSRDGKISFISLKSPKSAANFNAQSYHGLLNYAERHYPESHFSVSCATADELLASFSNVTPGSIPDLIAVPSRHRNLFARLFNPGMAHKLLFHTDIPMIVIPV
ncbi:MAG: universal stress protein [Clostridium sp.]|nr:universal stress protein [Clostridium sp.]